DAGKRFVDVTEMCNLRLPAGISGIAVADFDRDGRLDVYISRHGKQATGDWMTGKSGDRMGNQLWRNAGNWQFENVTKKSGADGGLRSSFTAVWFDANDDGWPDLYVPNEFGEGLLLI